MGRPDARKECTCGRRDLSAHIRRGRNSGPRLAGVVWERRTVRRDQCNLRRGLRSKAPGSKRYEPGADTGQLRDRPREMDVQERNGTKKHGLRVQSLQEI